MKNYYSYVISAMVWVLLTFSCRPTALKFTRTYFLENGTNHKIELKFFKSGTIQWHHTLIEVGDFFARPAVQGRSSKASALTAFWVPDSLIILFDESRKGIIHRKDSNFRVALRGIDKNLFSDEAYTIENNESYRYIFTEQDYENAEKITSAE